MAAWGGKEGRNHCLLTACLPLSRCRVEQLCTQSTRRKERCFHLLIGFLSVGKIMAQKITRLAQVCVLRIQMKVLEFIS